MTYLTDNSMIRWNKNKNDVIFLQKWQNNCARPGTLIIIWNQKYGFHLAILSAKKFEASDYIFNLKFFAKLVSKDGWYQKTYGPAYYSIEADVITIITWARPSRLDISSRLILTYLNDMSIGRQRLY